MRTLRYVHICDGFDVSLARVTNTAHWSERLVHLLEESGHEIGETIVVDGAGKSVLELVQDLDTAELAGPFDLVTVQVGSFDMNSNRSPQQLLADFGELLLRCDKLAGGNGWHVVVVEPNPLSVDENATLEDLSRVASTAFAATMERGSPHFAEIVMPTYEAIFAEHDEIERKGEEDRPLPFGRIAAAHAQAVFGPSAHLLAHGPPELPDKSEAESPPPHLRQN